MITKQEVETEIARHARSGNMSQVRWLLGEYANVLGIKPKVGHIPLPKPPAIVSIGSRPPNSRPISQPTHQFSQTGDILTAMFSKWEKYLDFSAEEGVSSEDVTAVAKAGEASCLGCSGLAAIMNQWGPDECEKQLDQIIKQVKANAGHFTIKLTGLPISSTPFFETIIKRFVVTAIKQSRKQLEAKQQERLGESL